MKKRKIAVTLTLIMLLLLPAFAEGYVTGRMDGGAIEVAWQVPQGDCVLTVYQGDWPLCVQNVQGGAGSLRVRVDDPTASYKLRLNTGAGCYTATVEGAKPVPTEVPTAAPTEAPTEAPTAVPTEVPTEAPTEAPTEVPTAVPTEPPVKAPTQAPTAKPTTAPTQAPTAKPTAAPAGIDRDDLASRVVQLVNEERAKQGLGTLRVDGELTRAACVRAGELTRSFSHTRPDGSKWSTVSASAFAENIARGQRTADKVMAAWMSSSDGPKENILRASYGSIGVCAYSYDGVMYWVQLFGK